tara:strand:+ start:423 stop:638 length:216 start_codon:yes stop_codon:yes gene_type:complete
MTKLFLILLLALGCSDNYELIDEKTRFNKKSGEIEVLEESGEWINKKNEEKKSNTNPNNKFSENNMTYFLL